MINPVETSLSKVEEGQEISIYHRIGKVVVAGVASVVAGWLAERAYDHFRDGESKEVYEGEALIEGDE